MKFETMLLKDAPVYAIDVTRVEVDHEKLDVDPMASAISICTPVPFLPWKIVMKSIPSNDCGKSLEGRQLVAMTSMAAESVYLQFILATFAFRVCSGVGRVLPARLVRWVSIIYVTRILSLCNKAAVTSATRMVHRPGVYIELVEKAFKRKAGWMFRWCSPATIESARAMRKVARRQRGDWISEMVEETCSLIIGFERGVARIARGRMRK